MDDNEHAARTGNLEVVPLGGHDWTVERTADLESLWQALGREEFGEDERLPYWAELWPSSQVLGAWLALNRDRIAGRPCLDLGCGMGLTALAGARLGARVVGLDYEWPAVAAARRNQDLNRHALPRHHGPLWVQMDWRSPGIRPGSLAFVWGGDVVYEKRFIRPVADFLDLALARDGVAWLAEPGRNFNRELCETLAGRGWNCGVAHEGRAISRDAPGLKVDVSVWELRR